MKWFALVLMVSAAAFAQQSAVVSHVQQLFEDGEFEAAVKKAEAAIGRAKSNAEAAQLQLTRGRALLALGDSSRARSAFVAAVKKDATVDLSVASAGQEAVDLLAAARNELQGTVTIVIPNGTASIRIDDKSMGPSPLTIKVAAGKHVIEATSSDGRKGREEVTIAANGKTTLSIELGSSTPPIEKPVSSPVVSAPVDSTPPPTEVSASARPSRRSLVGLIPGVAGLVVGGVGVGCLVASGAQYDRLASSTERFTVDSAEQARASGQTLQTLGFVGVGVGAAALVAGVVMLLVVKEPTQAPIQLSVSVTAQGSMVGLQGRF